VRPELVVIAGPTASGKTALAIEVARRLDAEIVGADSQQVYRYFDIGTGKPSADELAQVPHHLVSVVEPLEPYSAARFQAMADEAISAIHARGKRVVVVGGTGLYIRILLHGVTDAPGRDPEVRAELEAEAERSGRAALHARLAEVDPETAARISPNDAVRIIRALEIHALTGLPASEHRRQHNFAEERYPYRLYVLEPPRDALYERINRRVEGMWQAGLLEEARALAERGFRDAAPMRSVGYVQALAALEGRMTREQALEDHARQSRRYAKRQLTWFRREAGARFVAPPYDALLAAE
jgi:tRNA dimethylallyltransferase